MKVDFDLYLITDRQQTRGRQLESIIGEALAGGVRAVQLRERDLSIREIYRLAERLRRVTADAGARLLINDRVDVALGVEADGVHLRSDRMPIEAVRALVGPKRLIGVSTHSAEEILAASGADFAVMGPVYDTPTKRSYGPPLGIAALHKAVRTSRLPIFAIGGIGEDRVSEVCGAGAWGVAVVSAILAAPDVRGAAFGLCRAVSKAKPMESPGKP